MAVPLSPLEQVAPGIRRVAVPSPTLPPATTTNCWLLGDRDVVAVDPAGVTPAAQGLLHDALDAAGLRVRAVFLTHHHGDHIGGADALRRRAGAPLVAHPWTAAHLPLDIDEELDEGDHLDTDDGRKWRLLHTPGHAPGHLCAWDGETVLAGDMVAGEGTIVLDPPEGHLGRYLASLRRLRALDPVRLLPAHGAVLQPATAALDYYLSHRAARTDQVRAALVAATAPARPIDLVPGIYADLPAIFHPLAARQVLCHLQWLAERGLAVEGADGWETAA